MGETRERGVRATEEGRIKLQEAKGTNRDDNGKRWTYQSIADALELSVKTVQRFLKREQGIDESNARAICQVLGVNASLVLEEETSPSYKDKKGQLSSNTNQETIDSQLAPQNESSSETINIDVLVQTARDKIRDYINERCGTMRVLDMNQPIGLDDIYTNVNILEKITKSEWSSTEELLQNFRGIRFYRFCLGNVREEQVPGKTAVAKYSKLMILGKPGSGKTTFLKHIALKCMNGDFEPNRVPLFVTLKDFAETDSQPNLLEHLIQLFDSKLIDSQIVKQLIEQGRLLILLDGLDELQQVDNKRITKQIKDFTYKYHQNQFVITCRIAAREYIFDNFTDVEISDFNDEQIKTFAEKWFTTKNNKSIAEKFISELEKNKPIKELATSPILLTLLCLVFEQKGTFPQSRAELYEEGLDILIKKWDKKRDVERDQLPYKNLSPKQRIDLLCEIAYPTFENGKYFFKPEEVEEHIIQYYESLNIKQDIDTKKILESISAQHGLFVERAHGIYSFSHFTFHEYFTARKIKEAGSDELLRDLCTHIHINSTDYRWREVFLLVAGLMRNKAGQLLNLMEFEIRSYVNTPKLQALLRWAHEETAGSVGDIKPVGKRAFAISIATIYATAYIITSDIIYNAGLLCDASFDAYNIAETYIITNANYQCYGHFVVVGDCSISGAYYPINTAKSINEFIECTQDLQNITIKIFKNIDLTGLIAQMEVLLTQIPDSTQPESVRRSFIEHLIETWLHAFNLTPEMVNFSREESETLKHYFYGNYLIIECKEAAGQVAPSTWEAIEERMLRID